MIIKNICEGSAFRITVVFLALILLLTGGSWATPVGEWNDTNISISEVSQPDLFSSKGDRIIMGIPQPGDSKNQITSNTVFQKSPIQQPFNRIETKIIIIQYHDLPVIDYSTGLKKELELIDPIIDIKTERNKAASKIRSYQEQLSRKKSSIRNEIEKKNIKISYLREYSEIFNGIAAQVSEEDIIKLRKIPEIKAIYPDNKVQALLYESVPLINATKVWQMQDAGGRNITGKDVKVAIIDTGIDYTHPDLGRGFGAGYKVIGGWDIINRDPDPMDDHGHGTHVAGIVAANGSLKGVAPDALLMAYKVLDRSGSGSDSDVIAGIEMAMDPDGDPLTDDGADIISMSLGGWGDPDDPLSQAVDSAVNYGTVVVVAAGNSGPSSQTIFSPGTARKAITVGATNKDDTIASFSSRGPVVWKGGMIIKPDIVAPGVSIYSTVPTGNCKLCTPAKYLSLSGTSMATPMVSGAAALLLQKYPGWSPLEIKMALRNTAKYLSNDINTQGYGRIDSFKAAAMENAPLIAMLNTSGNVGGTININGTAAGTGFANYSLEYSNGNGTWQFIGKSSQSVNGNILFYGWDTTSVSNGDYFLRLIVKDSNGLSSIDQTMVNINTVELDYPLNNDIFRSGDVIVINGTIWGPIEKYTIEYGKGYDPTIWLDRGISITYSGSQNSTIRGMMATWNTSSIIEPDFYSLRVTVYRKASVSTNYVRIIYFDPSLKKGWPVKIGWDPYKCSQNSNEICYYFGGYLEPAINDIDNDGSSEIIIYRSGDPPKIYIFNPDGSPETGFPVNVGSELVYYNMQVPVIADINNDSLNEIIAFNHNSIYPESSELYAFMPNGSYVEGWPVLVPRDYQPNIIAADLDNDGQKEIIVKGNVNYSSTRYFTIVGAGGKIISKWQLNDINEGSPLTSTPAIGNFDNDTDFEIVVGVSNSTYDWNISKWNYKGVLHVFNLDGSEVSGWPVSTDGNPYSSPAIGDINKDGSPEIVIGLINGNGGVYAFFKNGTVMPGFPFMTGYDFWSSPSLADFNQDGVLEIAISKIGFENSETYVLYNNATPLPHWPQPTVWNDYYSTVAGDINNDGIPEIITTAGGGIPPYAGGGVYAWNVNGTLVSGFPKVTERDAQAPAALGDIDNDGMVDIVASSDSDIDRQTGKSKFRGTIYAWETVGKYDSQKMPWQTFHHDNGRTGLFDISNIIPVNRSTISLDIQNLVIPKRFERSLNLSIDSVPDGLSGYNISISVSDASIINITSIEFPEWTALFYNSSLPGDSVWLKAVDLDNKVQIGAGNLILSTLKIKGGNPGNASIIINVNSMDDDNGEAIDPITVSTRINVVSVVPLPGMDLLPSDPDGNGLFEDMNGNRRIDFSDVVLFFKYFEWIPYNEPVEYFDFNRNRRIDFNDIVKLFEML